MRIGGLWSPEAYRGAHRRGGYFEGWYFKLIDAKRENAFAVIPGVSLGNCGDDAHAFVQFIDASQASTAYFRFPLKAFEADTRRLVVRVGRNVFTEDGITLDLEQESARVHAAVRFDAVERYPRSILHPGIMGPFSFVPGMECRHDVIHIRHALEGSLTAGGRRIDLAGGEGYIEKDWGHSFPQSWVWLQAGHFLQPGVSFMLSFARIPWLGRSFPGLIAFLKTPDAFFRLATYNGARMTALSLKDGTLSGRAERDGDLLDFEAVCGKSGLLKAPKGGAMSREVEECITATLRLRLRRSDELLFEGESVAAGMEVCGKPEALL